MTPPRPELRALARRLIEDEAGRLHEPATLAAAAEAAFRALRGRLRGLIGEQGFQALLTRALKLARTEAEALEHVQVKPGGGLAGLSEVLATRSAAEAREAPACLLAHFLELLATFIGADLTTHLAERTPRDDGPRGRSPEET